MLNERLHATNDTYSAFAAFLARRSGLVRDRELHLTHDQRAGWGVAWYRDRDLRIFESDALPLEMAERDLLAALSDREIAKRARQALVALQAGDLVQTRLALIFGLPGA